jgi:hypothetical protein
MRGYQRGIWLPEMQAERTVTGGWNRSSGVAPRRPWSGQWPRPSRRPLRGLLRVRVRERGAQPHPPHCERQRSNPSRGAKGGLLPPSLAELRRTRRRFAPRNDAVGCAPAFSRRDAPGVLHFVAPSGNRGRREDRVRAAPAVSCARCTSKNAHEHTGSAETLRPSPRNGFTAYSALSPVTGLSCHRRP